MSDQSTTMKKGCLKIIGYILFVLLVLSMIGSLIEHVQSALERKKQQHSIDRRK